ncbi:MAG: class I SAM-dependent methyltransferase [Bacteroidetes bacterium]|nr:MAG: class I SAM-dependent methyltransferase [Bacteroidota bacterium]
MTKNKMSDKFIGKWVFPSDDSLLEQSARRGERYNFENIANDIIDKVHFEPEDIVMDLCCGNAALAKYVSKTCKEIHGVDHSEHLIRTANKIKEKESISNLHLYLSDAMNIDKLFREDFFDKSYCYFSFQYFNKRKRELLLAQLSRVTKRKGWIFLGDIPDKTRIWNFYESPKKFYREKISRILQFKEGECNLGWWIDPKEIVQWCDSHRLNVSIMPQDKNMPHAHYRFDVLIRNSK